MRKRFAALSSDGPGGTVSAKALSKSLSGPFSPTSTLAQGTGVPESCQLLPPRPLCPSRRPDHRRPFALVALAFAPRFERHERRQVEAAMAKTPRRGQRLGVPRLDQILD